MHHHGLAIQLMLICKTDIYENLTVYSFSIVYFVLTLAGGFYDYRSSKMLISWLASLARVRRWRWDVIIGVFTGFSTSLISISLARLLHQAFSPIRSICAAWALPMAARLRKTCFLVAYFSFAGWLAIKYGKRLGLPGIQELISGR